MALENAVELAGPMTIGPYCSTDYDLYAEEWSASVELTPQRQRALCLISEALAVGRDVPVRFEVHALKPETLMCEVGIRARMSPLARALAKMMPGKEV